MAFDLTHRSLFVSALAASGLVVGLATVPAAHAAPVRTATSTVADLTSADAATDGAASPGLLVAPAGRPVARPQGLPSSASDETVARAHLASVASRFGVSAAPSSLRATGSTDTKGVGSVVRFTQLVGGVPVYGGDLVVSMDEHGNLDSVGGDTVPTTPLAFTVTSGRAASVAANAAAAKLKVSVLSLTVGTPSKFVYDPQLVGDQGSGVHPVWRVVVTGARGSDSQAEVLVDAGNGQVRSITATAEHAANRAICDAGPSTTGWNSDAAYGWCGENDTEYARDTNNDGIVIDPDQSAVYDIPADDPVDVDVPYTRIEGGASVNSDVDDAYTALGDTSDFYQNVLGFDLTSNIGASDTTIGAAVSSDTRHLAGVVRYCDPREAFLPYVYLSYDPSDWVSAETSLAQQNCAYGNAYWLDADPSWTKASGTPFPGGQMFIGQGLAKSEDVIGHELTHGVTSEKSGLLYKNESGAINESMSDIFGQLVEEYKAPQTDPGWLIGEKLNGPVLSGAIRSMSQPTRTDLPSGDKNGQPDSMISSRWSTDVDDAGGVHTNSGVGNKAAWLIAHGGNFNGVHVYPLDRVDAADTVAATTKVAKLYWEVQNELPSNANYRRLALTLSTACNKLIGTSGFTWADCQNSVGAAIAATYMTYSRTTLVANHTSLNYGKTVTLTAHVGDARNGGVGGVTIKLQRKLRGSNTWYNVSTGRTGLSSSTYGKKIWIVKPIRSASYRVVYSGAGIWKSSTSPARYVALKPSISKKLSAKKIRFGRTFKVTGKVGPSLAKRTVYLQRYSGGKWHTVKKAKLTSKSTYTLKYKPKSHADRSFRVYIPASASYGSGVSSKFRVTVS